jgi:DinB superfamily
MALRDGNLMLGQNEFSLTDTITLLSRTPAAVNELLCGLPDIWARSNEGSDTWSAFDVVGHLICAERTDWMPRVRLILETGETRPFEPFDRFAQIKENEGKSLEEILNEFGRARTGNLASLRLLNLQKEDLARRGKHPALGTVTLAQLLATWAVHDLTHLHQISRVMARQYREAVGPWSTYLGVPQCNGHSAS